MNSTKKMPSSLNKDGQPSRSSEFVIPMPENDDHSNFIGLKTGKKHKLAAITYIGKEITAEDILEKFSNFHGDRNRFIGRLDKFIGALQKFKVGNVISISYLENNDFTINLESHRPILEKRMPLP